MQFLIEALGSHGDVIPFIGVAAELRRRGHDVRLYGSDRFEPLAGAAGIPFAVTFAAAEHVSFLSDARATESREGLPLIAAGLLGNVEHALEVMKPDIGAHCVFIGSMFAFASRLAAEIHRRPFIPIHLAAAAYRSEYMAPRFSPLGHFESWPRWFKRALWKLMDRRFLDPIFCAPLNEIRARLGLEPVTRVFHSWLHEGAVNIAAFPEWFAARQPDWPQGLRFTGFPLPRRADEPSLSAELEAFVSRGDAPIVFTAGTANTSSHAFYAQSAAACSLLRRRGILVAQRRDQLPQVLPEGVVHAAYVPFAALFPRAAAVVHHGGIGTLSQALAAGVPQLIQPMAYDQFDNASRARRLGVARELLPRKYLAPTVARELELLVASPATMAACAASRSTVARENGVAAICDLVESAKQ